MKRLWLFAPLILAVAALSFDDLRLRSELGALKGSRVEKGGVGRVISDRSGPPVKRPRMDVRVKGPEAAPGPEGDCRYSEEEVREAVASHLANMRERRKAELEELKERRKNLTDEQRLAQRDAFLGKMRERSERRMRQFVEKTGLSAEHSKAFESTVAALDTTLREAADAWAEKIRTSGAFNTDSRVKFISEMSAIIGAGYSEMDSTLPADWHEQDGDLNIMEIVGPEALSSVVEALTENGLEDGLQAVGQVMGGPQGEGGPAGGGDDGMRGPGADRGPGGPGGMGGPGF